MKVTDVVARWVDRGYGPDLFPDDPYSILFVVHRFIDSLPGYCFGSDGSVWAKTRDGRGWKRMSVNPGKSGYLHVTLGPKHSRRSYRVHTLILWAFFGPKPPGHEACHFPDSSRDNVKLSNLRWDTPRGNMDDQFRHGSRTRSSRRLLPAAKASAGSPYAKKLNTRGAREIKRLLNAGAGLRHIAGLFGVSEATISRIKTGKIWAHVNLETASHCGQSDQAGVAAPARPGSVMILSVDQGGSLRMRPMTAARQGRNSPTDRGRPKGGPD
jgi:hypothetical protein